MYRLIHCKQRPGAPDATTECINRSDYHLIIYYSGHGRGSKDVKDVEDGSWAPMASKDGRGYHKDWITWKYVQQHTLMIRGLHKENKTWDGCDGCVGSCM